MQSHKPNTDSDKTQSIFQMKCFGFLIVAFFIMVLQVITYLVVARTSILTICNEGISFGVLLPPAVFWIVWGGVIFLVVREWRKSHGGVLSQLPYILIIAGALSNIIDRLVRGCVIDYIHVSIRDFSNVFNLADSLIFVGVVILLWQKHKHQ